MYDHRLYVPGTCTDSIVFRTSSRPSWHSFPFVEDSLQSSVRFVLFIISHNNRCSTLLASQLHPSSLTVLIIMSRQPLIALLLALFAVSSGFAFSPLRQQTTSYRQVRTTADSSRPYSMSTVEAPTREDVDRRTRRGGDDGDLLGDKEENFEDEMRKQGPLEWLEDSEVSRDMEEPFHILLLGQTFEKPKITVPYVASSLNYVLDMPTDEATELSQFSYDHGMSCLGTWPREECLSLGRQLQIRDIVCRVVPFCEGGHRGWQARDADTGADDYSSLKDAGY